MSNSTRSNPARSLDACPTLLASPLQLLAPTAARPSSCSPLRQSASPLYKRPRLRSDGMLVWESLAAVAPALAGMTPAAGAGGGELASRRRGKGPGALEG